MTPLTYYLTIEKINKRYDRKKSKITEEQAITWIAEDIVRYLIRNKKNHIEIIVCHYAYSDYIDREYTLIGLAPYYIKRSKTNMAYYKFRRTTDFQEKVIEKLKIIKRVRVIEKVEQFEPHQQIYDYRKTATVCYDETNKR